MKKILLTMFIAIFLIGIVSAQIILTNNPSGDLIIPNHQANINTTIDFNDSIYTLDTVQVNLSGQITNIKDPSLILCYNFDNRSELGENDTKVVDWCGGNNGTIKGWDETGTYSNVSMTPNGKYNGAVNFSGNAGRVTTPDNPVLRINNQTNNGITISLWYYANGFSNSVGGTNYLVRKGSEYRIYYAKNENKFWFLSNNVGTDKSIVSTITPTTDGWHQLVLTWNLTSLRWYKDGVLVQNSSFAWTPNTGTSSLDIGAFSATANQWNGTLDEVRIFNKTLTPLEIYGNYQVSCNKFNTTQTNCYSNLTLNSLSNTFNIFANDTLGNDYTTNLQNINRKQVITLTSNINAIINPIFYGVNYNSNGGGLSFADSYDSKTAFLNAKFKIIRLTAYLENKVNSDMTIKSGTSVTQDRDTFIFAHDNGLKIQLIAKNMPTFTMNQSSPLCNDNGLSCPSIDGNYSIFAQTIVAYITNMTNNGLWNDTIESIEVLNEPDTGFLNVTFGGIDNVTYALEYVKMFNATYDAVKAVYPDIKVVGASSTNKGYVNYINTYLSNLSSRIEGITDHMYWRAPPNGIVQTLLRDSNNLSAVCLSYSTNCSMIYSNEWNLNIDDTTEYTAFHSMGTGANYIDMLNNYANRSSLMLYTWFNNDNFSIFNVTGNYAYPYSPYSVTANFTRYAPSGFNVYNSSVDYNGILSVYTKSQDGKTNNLIITNTENDLQNISSILPSGTYIKVSGNNSGTLINSNGVDSVNLGVLDNYEVGVWTTPTYSQRNGVGSFNNYLGEPIREMTNEEHDAYFPDSLGCDTNYFTGSNIILVLTALALISFVIFFTFKDGMAGITTGKLIMLFVVILVCLALFVGSAQNLGNYCNG